MPNETTASFLELKFPASANPLLVAATRINAVFIYGKLVEGGMSAVAAKSCIEDLFHDAVYFGFNDGMKVTTDIVNNAFESVK